MEVKARRVAGFYEAKDPGDYFIKDSKDGVRRLQFYCPCGCGILCGIKIRDDGQQIDGAWGWDGNEDCPTTTPSILVNGDHWHGYLTNGIFRSC